MTAMRIMLAAMVVLVFALRIAVLVVQPQPVVSDALAYLHMAETFAAGLPMRDNFGSAAFYSPGYPLLLGTVFKLTGASLAVVFAVNVVLAALTAVLIARLAKALGGSVLAQVLAVAAYAVWLPSLLACATVAKENLTLPLLLGFVLGVLAVLRGEHPVRAAIVAGLCYAAGLLAGASTLFVIVGLGLVLILMLARRQAGATTRVALAFGLASAVVLTPWLAHTQTLFGKPVLTTNGGFNLYLGNNPAATGAFVSIADTPKGRDWHAMRATLGEAGSADALGKAAVDHALANPGRTATLAAVKIGSFWAPNIPDAADDARVAMRIVRWADVVQHMLILALALIGAWGLRRDRRLAVLLAIVGTFWATHAITYVMVRYREPVMPILIVLAALAVASLWRKRTA